MFPQIPAMVAAAAVLPWREVVKAAKVPVCGV
jgi:hypothetical protein